jgi:hypothetical protein
VAHDIEATSATPPTFSLARPGSSRALPQIPPEALAPEALAPAVTCAHAIVAPLPVVTTKSAAAIVAAT